MSNEVNQAYLRAYIKNRVASSGEPESSQTLPARQTVNNAGQPENTYRRADAGRVQPPAPRSSRIAGETAPAVRTPTRPAPAPHPAATRPVAVRPSVATPAQAAPSQVRPSVQRTANPQTPSTARAVSTAQPIGAPQTLPTSALPNVGAQTRSEANRAPQVTAPVVEFRPQDRLPSNEVAGVWSPLGAERGVKGAGVFRTQPAVVVNGTPYMANTAVETNRFDDQPILSRLPATAPRTPHAPSAPSPETYERAYNPAAPESSVAPTGRSVAERSDMPSTLRNVGGSGQTVRFDAPHTTAYRSTGSSNAPVAGNQTLNYPASTSQQPRLDIDADRQSRAYGAETRESSTHQAHLAPAVPAPHSREMRSRSPEFVEQEIARKEIERKLVQGERKTAPKPPIPVVEPKTEVAERFATQPAFKPSWEVDRFFWPEVLYQLEASDRQAFSLIGRHLKSANDEGLRVMAVTSGERGVGRSTVAMHLARAAAAAGLSVALVDADTNYPSLIDHLRLDMDHGWQDSLFENVSLEEVAVRSVEDNLTVFPITSIVAPQQLHANLKRVAQLIGRIADSHDIVFLDSNRLNLEQRDLVGVSDESFVDAAVVVVDTELSIKEKVDTAVSILQGMGIASIGMVENFHA